MGDLLLDLSGYIKFFVGLFALVNPVGILPVFISMTHYQPRPLVIEPTWLLILLSPSFYGQLCC